MRVNRQELVSGCWSTLALLSPLAAWAWRAHLYLEDFAVATPLGDFRTLLVPYSVRNAEALGKNKNQ